VIICHVASSHPPARTAATGVSPEFFLFVLFFDLRRFHGLRKGQREGVAVEATRLRDAAFPGNLSLEGP
jgi:hypothetical protein